MLKISDVTGSRYYRYLIEVRQPLLVTSQTLSHHHFSNKVRMPELTNATTHSELCRRFIIFRISEW